MSIQHSILSMVLSALILNHLVFSTILQGICHDLNLTNEEAGHLRNGSQSYREKWQCWNLNMGSSSAERTLPTMTLSCLIKKPFCFQSPSRTYKCCSPGKRSNSDMILMKAFYEGFLTLCI